jgi:hypothetical protein
MNIKKLNMTPLVSKLNQKFTKPFVIAEGIFSKSPPSFKINSLRSESMMAMKNSTFKSSTLRNSTVESLDGHNLKGRYNTDLSDLKDYNSSSLLERMVLRKRSSI